jgi:hypothetical protein
MFCQQPQEDAIALLAGFNADAVPDIGQAGGSATAAKTQAHL